MPNRKKPPASDFDDAKQRVEAKLLPLDYVSGIGGSGSELHVMLERPISGVENDHIRTVMQNEAAGFSYTIVQTGRFRKL